MKQRGSGIQTATSCNKHAISQSDSEMEKKLGDRSYWHKTFQHNMQNTSWNAAIIIHRTPGVRQNQGQPKPTPCPFDRSHFEERKEVQALGPAASPNLRTNKTTREMFIELDLRDNLLIDLISRKRQQNTGMVGVQFEGGWNPLCEMISLNMTQIANNDDSKYHTLQPLEQ